MDLTYETVKSISAMTGLMLFIVLFALVLLYAFWPANAEGFKEAARIPLDKDDNIFLDGGRNER